MEEISVIKESCNPVEIQHIAWWQLSKYIGAMLTAVIAEKACASCPPRIMKSAALLQKISSRHST